jgi:hypothetical protein
MAQEIHRQERNQKDMAARLNLPHSLVHEPRVFDPPSHIPNLWEDLGSWVPADDEEEKKITVVVSVMMMRTTTRSSSLFGACCQSGSEI